MAYTSTPTHGKTSRCEKNDVAVAFTDGWDMNITRGMADKTSQGDTWESQNQGILAASGTLSGKLALGNTEQKAIYDAIIAGSTLTDMKFLIDGTAEGWSGNIDVTDFNVNAQKGDNVSVSISWKNNGALTLSDAQ